MLGLLSLLAYPLQLFMRVIRDFKPPIRDAAQISAGEQRTSL